MGGHARQAGCVGWGTEVAIFEGPSPAALLRHPPGWPWGAALAGVRLTGCPRLRCLGLVIAQSLFSCAATAPREGSSKQRGLTPSPPPGPRCSFTVTEPRRSSRPRAPSSAPVQRPSAVPPPSPPRRCLRRSPTQRPSRRPHYLPGRSDVDRNGNHRRYQPLRHPLVDHKRPPPKPDDPLRPLPEARSHPIARRPRETALALPRDELWRVNRGVKRGCLSVPEGGV